MCIFTHFAAGALAGAATGHAGWAVAAGLGSHALLDIFPHYDFDDWRVEVGLGLALLLLLLLTPLATTPAVVGALAGCLPDLENLLWKLGRLDKRRMLFPTHTGLIPHGAARGPRNLILQAALAAACFVALGLVAPPAATAQPLDATPAQDSGGDLAVFAVPRARLLAADAGRTSLEVSFPLARAPRDWRSLAPARVIWAEPGPVLADADGKLTPTPPEHRVNLAVPAMQSPAWQVTGVRWWREPERAVAPEEFVRVDGPARFRDVPLVTVAVNPETPGGGLVAAVTLSLHHPPDAEGAEWLLAAARAERVESGRMDEPLAAALILNRDLHAGLAAGATRLRAHRQQEASKARAPHPFGLTPRWVRLEVDETAVYSLSGYDLSLLGVPPADVESGTLRLYRGHPTPQPRDPAVAGSWMDDWIGLGEVAVQVRDEDGVWDSGDRLLFYGFGGDVWADRIHPAHGPLVHHEHPYHAGGVYWLTWEPRGGISPLPGEPRRIGPPASATPSGAPPVTLHRARLHLERSFEDVTGRVADNWAWDARILTQRDFAFDLGAVTADSAALFVVDVRCFATRLTPSETVNQASAWFNEDGAGALTRSWTVRMEEDSLRVRLVGQTGALRGGANRLTLRNDRSGLAPDLILDSFDLFYWAPLAKPAGGQLAFAHWGAQAPEPGPVDFQIALASAATVQVWDVSDAAAPRRLLGQQSGGAALAFGVDRTPEAAAHFVLFTDADLRLPPVRARRNPVDLRATLPGVDYVAIHDPLLAAPAAQLAALRAESLPGVAQPAAVAVSEETVYDNFSGGAKDPLALRNFLKWAYNRDGRLRYACLVGDASRDHRNYLNHNPATQNVDLLPTVVRTYFPKRPQIYFGYANLPYATDDGLVCFDAPAGGKPLDIPDLAVGRLTARDAAEAAGMVARIRDLALSPPSGLWRNRVAFVADDLGRGTIPNETEHTAQAEALVNNYLPLSLDVTKLYLVEYEVPPGASYKPQARQDAKRTLSEGITIFHYIGHGADNTLADEQVFLTEDIYTLTNGPRRGLFLAMSCEVGVYDSPKNQSMAEVFIAQASGGAIASIAASEVSYVAHNNRLSNYFYRALYPERRVDPAVSLGEALLAAKVGIGNDPEAAYVGTWMPNSQRYTLLGDPALALPQPASALQFAAGSADTLRAGGLATVRVDLAAAGLPPGTPYDLLVQESRANRRVEVPPLTYWLPGGAVYRGGATTEGSELEFSFRVPTQARYGAHGRVRAIVDGPDGALAGAATLPVVAAPLPPGADVAGPEISLAFADNRRRVPPGAALRAGISDTSGISVLGSNPSNSILYELDDSNILTNVTDAFAFVPGSFTAGQLELSLPADLAQGRHMLRLYASDALGNVGTDTLSFQVVSASVPGFAEVMLFPNPTPGPCRLLFELSAPMSVEWHIHTVSGRRIWSGRDSLPAGPQVMTWEGRDADGDEVANGVYLYVLKGRWEGSAGREATRTGQIVIMK